MTSSAEELILNEIAPRLRSGIAHTVAFVGSEDEAELLQDGIVIALGMLQSARKNGKAVTPGNVAYFTLKHLRSGRRSTGYHNSDVLHPGAQLNGRSRMHLLDEPVSGEDIGDESFTLGDVLASRSDDSGTEASRKMDWEQLAAKLDSVTTAILSALVDGRELTMLVPSLGLSRSSLQNHKHRLATLIQEILGDDILALAQERPGWIDGIFAAREKASCRWERQAA